MRITLIILVIMSVSFIGGILWFFSQKNNFQNTDSMNSVQVSGEIAISDILRDQGKAEYRIKEAESQIKALEEKLNKLIVDPENTTLSVGGSGSKNIDTTSKEKSQNTLNTTNSTTPSPIIPISAKFLTKIISKINLTLVPNSGIYNTTSLDSAILYSTYTDSKYGISIIATRTPYSYWLDYWKTLNPPLYTVYENKIFKFPSFYLNAIKPDDIVRIVIQVESQSLLISIPKSKFPEFKTMINKK